MVKMKKKEKVVTEVLNQKADPSKNEEKAEMVKEQAKGNITVFCGIPMGLKLNLKSGVVVLNGIPMSHIVSARKGEGYLPAGKFGQTVISLDKWEEIKHKYEKYDFMLNGTIFAKESVEEGVELAIEKSEKRLGFEQAELQDASKRTQPSNSEE